MYEFTPEQAELLKDKFNGMVNQNITDESRNVDESSHRQRLYK